MSRSANREPAHRRSADRQTSRKRTASAGARPVGTAASRSPKSDRRPLDSERLQALAETISRQKIPEREVRRLQHEIYDQTLLLSRSIDRPNFSRVSSDDVARMVRMYDERFFGGKIVPAAEAEGLTFKVSSRMTRIAGKLVTHYPDGIGRGSSRDRGWGRRKFELVLSSTLLFQTFEDVSRPVEVTGCRCRNRLEAMQRVTEHELVHLVEMLIWNDGNCNEPRFQSIAQRYFKHTDYQHDLITQRERAARKFNIRVGDQVRFPHDGRYLTGRVNRITRRATVLVPHEKGERFSDGGRYLRFYVPLEKLRLA